MVKKSKMSSSLRGCSSTLPLLACLAGLSTCPTPNFTSRPTIVISSSPEQLSLLWRSKKGTLLSLWLRSFDIDWDQLTFCYVNVLLLTYQRVSLPGWRLYFTFLQTCQLGAVHILRNTWWGGRGLPDLLQYYIGGGLLNLLQYYRGGVFKIYYNITVLKGKWKVIILFQL